MLFYVERDRWSSQYYKSDTWRKQFVITNAKQALWDKNAKRSEGFARWESSRRKKQVHVLDDGTQQTKYQGSLEFMRFLK